MEKVQYEKYKLITSFEDRLEDIRNWINKKPIQLNAGHSKIGYMSDEIKQLNEDLNRVIDMHKEIAKLKKQTL